MRKSQLPEIPLVKLLPSIVTLCSLCLGITSIRYALDDKWHIAAMLILVAGIMDWVDGGIARMLNATSSFGAHLDSLSDIVSFGVAPAVITYFWSLSEIPIKGVGWAVVLMYISCSAIRLARFNTGLEKPKEKRKVAIFTGLPMPAAALLCILPMISTFEIFEGYKISHWFISFYMILLAFLMISRIPIYSIKGVLIKREYVPLLMAALALTIAGIILEPWIVIPFLLLIIVALIPFSLISEWRKGNGKLI